MTPPATENGGGALCVRARRGSVDELVHEHASVRVAAKIIRLPSSCVRMDHPLISTHSLPAWFHQPTSDSLCVRTGPTVTTSNGASPVGTSQKERFSIEPSRAGTECGREAYPNVSCVRLVRRIKVADNAHREMVHLEPDMDEEEASGEEWRRVGDIRRCWTS
jgi:hypothetical protein